MGNSRIQEQKSQLDKTGKQVKTSFREMDRIHNITDNKSVGTQ